MMKQRSVFHLARWRDRENKNGVVILGDSREKDGVGMSSLSRKGQNLGSKKYQCRCQWNNGDAVQNRHAQCKVSSESFFITSTVGQVVKLHHN